MTDEQREEIARTLEWAASEVRSGRTFDFLVVTPDEYEFESLEGAKGTAQGWLEVDPDVGWHPEIDHLSWGVYVPVQVSAETDRYPAPEGSDFDEFIDYSLVSPWAKAVA